MPGDVDIFVCVACIEGNGGSRGAAAYDLIEAVRQRLAAGGTTGITVRPVECLAVCKRPLTIALAGAGKWTYVLGDIDASAHADDIAATAIAFQRTTNGIVPWAERPQPFRQGVIARIPPLGFVQQPLPETA